MREAVPHEVCFIDSESLADHLDVFHGKNFVHFISRFVSDELELNPEQNRTELEASQQSTHTHHTRTTHHTRIRHIERTQHETVS